MPWWFRAGDHENSRLDNSRLVLSPVAVGEGEEPREANGESLASFQGDYLGGALKSGCVCSTL